MSVNVTCGYDSNKIQLFSRHSDTTNSDVVTTTEEIMVSSICTSETSTSKFMEIVCVKTSLI